MMIVMDAFIVVPMFINPTELLDRPPIELILVGGFGGFALILAHFGIWELTVNQ